MLHVERELSTVSFPRIRSDAELDGLIYLTATSAFVPSQHVKSLQQAWRSIFHDDDLIYGTLLALPALEHSLLQLYCITNPHCESKRIAKKDEYFVTLDGFGQKSAGYHDLLLSPYRLDGEPNELVSVLGVELHTLLTDFFLQRHGPKLRSRIVHREIVDDDNARESIFGLACAFACLLQRFALPATLQLDSTHEPYDANAQPYFDHCECVIDKWVSSLFIPPRVLYRRMKHAWQAAARLLGGEYSGMSISMYGSASERGEVRVTLERSSHIVASFVDKESSLRLLQSESEASAERTIVDALQTMEAKMSASMLNQCIGPQLSHELLNGQPERVRGHETAWWRDHAQLSIQNGRRESLKCHIAVAEEVERAITAVEEAIDELGSQSEQRKARTAQRRTLVRMLRARRLLAAYVAWALNVAEMEARGAREGQRATVYLQKVYAVSRRVRMECERRAVDAAVEAALTFVRTKASMQYPEAGAKGDAYEKEV